MKKTNENGITLIALVVTIVVLLILAGITITYVLADGGIFSSARDAKVAAKKAAIQDYASQIQSNALIAKYTTTTGLAVDDEDELQKFFPDGYVVKPNSAAEMTFTEEDGEEGKKKPGTVNGQFIVTITGEEGEYTVKFTKGVCKVYGPGETVE